MPTVTTQDIFIDPDDGRLFARRLTPDAPGRQAPVVLFHDSLGCVELWRDFPQQLAMATVRAGCAYDRLGLGRSDPHPGKLGLDFVDQEARQGFHPVRQALGLDRYVAFGHSVGGGMALVCAVADGEACDALITESAQMYAEEHTLAGIRQAKAAFAQPGQLDRLKKYHGEKAAWVLSAWIDTWLSPGFADWSLDGYLRQVRCPGLALHGEHDEYRSRVHPRRNGEVSMDHRRVRSASVRACSFPCVPSRDKHTTRTSTNTNKP